MTTVLQIEAAARRAAFVVAGQTRFADVRPHWIDGAGGGDADLPHQRRAAIAIAAHAAAFVIDEPARDALQRGVVLQGKPRPLGGIAASGAAGLAIERLIESRPAIAGAFDPADTHYRCRALRAA
jgi:hypothetical protein